MQFYKVMGTVTNQKWVEENNDRRTMHPLAKRTLQGRRIGFAV